MRDRLPPGFNTAFKIVKQFIDPGLECDAYADEPWLYGPALSCWFALNVGEKDTSGLSKALKDDKSIVFEGGQGSGHDVRSELGLPDTADKRRKFFLDREHREKFVFEQGRLYEGDFHNPYLDFSSEYQSWMQYPPVTDSSVDYALKLPGFSLGVLKYIGDKTHTLRYVFKDRKTGDVFFVVVITLLFGQQLQDVIGQNSIKKNGWKHNADDVD